MPAQSKAQQRFMGMVHAVQKGDMEAPSKEVEKAADSMSDKAAKDFAATSHKGLPNKKENMKITKERLKELVKEVMTEESEYQAFFQKALDKAGKSIPSMSDDEKKAFFNKIDTAWSGKGEKNEELTGKQHKLDIDKDGDIGSDDLADLRAGKKVDEVGELPNATIPASIKSKLVMAIDKIKDSKLNYNQKIQVIGQVMDSLGIDKSEFNKMSSKLKGTMESTIKEESPCWKGYQQIGMKDKNGKQVPNCVPEGKMNEGKKRFKQQNGIGSSKYTISYHDGKKKHKDGSDFFDIKIFKNKPELETFKKDLVSKGFVSESINEAAYDQKIKSVMQNSTSSFKNLGNDFKNAGLKYNFSTTPFPHYIVEPGGNKKVAIISRKNESDLKGSGIQYSTYIATIKESVNEGVSPKDMDKIKSAVEAASSFMNVGAQLKSAGLRYIFATEPMAIYIVNPTPNTKVAIINKRYASKPDFVVGDIAVGIMEGIQYTKK